MSIVVEGKVQITFILAMNKRSHLRYSNKTAPYAGRSGDRPARTGCCGRCLLTRPPVVPKSFVLDMLPSDEFLQQIRYGLRLFNQ